MAFKFFIRGEIVPFQDEWIIENGYCNLAYVQNQLIEANGEDVEIGIGSFGGDVDTGFSIYAAIRRYAKEHNAKITTRADGQCASIATVIFLAGDTRIGNKYVDPFIHNAWVYEQGDAKKFVRVAAELEKTNARIAQFYAEHTNLTYEEARALMENDTSITAEEAINIRFATEIEEVLRPVALQKFTNKSNKNMSDNTEKGLLSHLKKFFNNEGTIKNLEVFTSTNETLLFPDLEEGQSPSVGDKATVDGKPADGRITVADGTVYVFTSGVLDEIIQPEGESEIDALKKENAALKEQLTAQNAKIDGIVAKQVEADARWNKLKNTISTYNIEDKGEGEKTPEGEKKVGLSKAVANLKKYR